jgi:SAM-dependent methyltransferase
MPSMSHDDFLKLIRAHELESAIQLFPPAEGRAGPSTLLEIGAGTGQQARMLASRGYNVTAIDMPNSHYRNQRVFPVTDYDGLAIPCAKGSIDILFSSNVLEHVAQIDRLLDETSRVMASGGVAIHILPTSSCRVWSIPAHYVWTIRRLMNLHSTPSPSASAQNNVALKIPTDLSGWLAAAFPRKHGERGTAITESFYYSQSWWRRKFESHGFVVDSTQKNHLFYTMANALTDTISIESRIKLSRLLGSSCRIYVLRKTSSSKQDDA